MLICSELSNGIKIIKVIIPQILATDMIIQVHREYNCIKSGKMISLISIKFEIKNLKDICVQVAENCMQCNKTAVQPAGSQRQDLRKDPALVRRACQVWAVDELQIVSEETGNKMAGYHKILLAGCMQCIEHK